MGNRERRLEVHILLNGIVSRLIDMFLFRVS